MDFKKEAQEFFKSNRTKTILMLIIIIISVFLLLSKYNVIPSIKNKICPDVNCATGSFRYHQSDRFICNAYQIILKILYPLDSKFSEICIGFTFGARFKIIFRTFLHFIFDIFLWYLIISLVQYSYLKFKTKEQI